MTVAARAFDVVSERVERLLRLSHLPGMPDLNLQAAINAALTEFVELGEAYLVDRSRPRLGLLAGGARLSPPATPAKRVPTPEEIFETSVRQAVSVMQGEARFREVAADGIVHERGPNFAEQAEAREWLSRALWEDPEQGKEEIAAAEVPHG